jgi:hypothetical protein
VVTDSPARKEEKEGEDISYMILCAERGPWGVPCSSGGGFVERLVPDVASPSWGGEKR